MVLPVVNSAMAGTSGLKSDGLKLKRNFKVCPKDLILLAANNFFRISFLKGIGISETESVPPATITSACHVLIKSTPLEIAAFAEIHA